MSERVLVDTNVLLRWVRPDDRDYVVVGTAIERLLSERATLCYTSQNMAEFWNTCTRPIDKNGFGLRTDQTNLRAGVIEKHLLLLADSVAVHREWRRIVVDDSVSGVQVHDARLVAAMRVHGVPRILTFNQRDFVRYAGIEALHPQMVR